MEQYFLIKLNNGDEVIGKGTIDDRGDMCLSKARIIQMLPQGPQTYGLALIPLFAGDPDGTSRIFNASVMAWVSDVPERLVKAYMQQTSAIELATSLPGQ